MWGVKAEAKIPAYSQQVLIVITPSWKSITGKMIRYERKNIQSSWKQVGSMMPAVVGRNGMGWGRGLYNPEDASQFLFRREGDKRAPAGVFTFGTSFGILPNSFAKNTMNVKIPYLEIDRTTQCVGDNRSKFYNDIVNNKTTPKDWNKRSNEDMYRIATRGSKVYRWGIEINNNKDTNPDPRMQRKRRAGACIFLHVWKNAFSGTAGCTAGTADDLVKIMTWLNPTKYPVIVQLPIHEYQRLQKKWLLPELEN